MKMKLPVADKLVVTVSLLGVEREEDATALFSSVLGTWMEKDAK